MTTTNQTEIARLLGNGLSELRNIHADQLNRTAHAPTGCPCSGGLESCPAADAIEDLEKALALLEVSGA